MVNGEYIYQYYIPRCLIWEINIFKKQDPQVVIEVLYVYRFLNFESYQCSLRSVEPSRCIPALSIQLKNNKKFFIYDRKELARFSSLNDAFCLQLFITVLGFMRAAQIHSSFTTGSLSIKLIRISSIWIKSRLNCTFVLFYCHCGILKTLFRYVYYGLNHVNSQRDLTTRINEACDIDHHWGKACGRRG